MRFSFTKATAFSLSLLAALSSTLGCSTACDTTPGGNPPERYRDGLTDGTGYDSSHGGTHYLWFPGGKQFALEHGLGHAPLLIQTFLSFSADGSNIAPGAGDPVDIPCYDNKVIVVRNGTCSEFYLRVVALGSIPGDAISTRNCLREPDGGSAADALSPSVAADGGNLVDAPSPSVASDAPDGQP